MTVIPVKDMTNAELIKHIQSLLPAEAVFGITRYMTNTWAIMIYPSQVGHLPFMIRPFYYRAGRIPTVSDKKLKSKSTRSVLRKTLLDCLLFMERNDRVHGVNGWV